MSFGLRDCEIWSFGFGFGDLEFMIWSLGIWGVWGIQSLRLGDRA